MSIVRLHKEAKNDQTSSVTNQLITDKSLLDELESCIPSDYNRTRFSIDAYRKKNFDSLKIGRMFPDVYLYSLTGEKVHIHDFAGSNIIIETGSLSCPIFMSKIESMNTLMKMFPDQVFLVIYVREECPGSMISAHRSLHQKLSYASELRSAHKDKRLILVDEIWGEVHSLFDGMPNAALVLNDKMRVIYRSCWSVPSDIQILLSGLLLSKRNAPYHGLVAPTFPKPLKILSTLSKVGYGSLTQYLINAPQLLINRLSMRQYLRRYKSKNI